MNERKKQELLNNQWVLRGLYELQRLIKMFQSQFVFDKWFKLTISLDPLLYRDHLNIV